MQYTSGKSLGYILPFFSRWEVLYYEFPFFENQSEILILGDSTSWWERQSNLLGWIVLTYINVCEISLGNFKVNPAI